MLDMSWGEVMIIGAVALIVIGPKDLPRALRTVGQVTGRLRRMAAEFQTQFNEAMREAELDDVKDQLKGMNDSVSSMNTGFNPIQTVRDELKSSIEAPVSSPAASAPAVPAPPADPVDLPPPPEPIGVPLEEIAAALNRQTEADSVGPAASHQSPSQPDKKAE